MEVYSAEELLEAAERCGALPVVAKIAACLDTDGPWHEKELTDLAAEVGYQFTLAGLLEDIRSHRRDTTAVLAEPQDLPPGFFYCGRCSSVLPITFWHRCDETSAQSGLHEKYK